MRGLFYLASGQLVSCDPVTLPRTDVELLKLNDARPITRMMAQRQLLSYSWNYNADDKGSSTDTGLELKKVVYMLHQIPIATIPVPYTGRPQTIV